MWLGHQRHAVGLPLPTHYHLLELRTGLLEVHRVGALVSRYLLTIWLDPHQHEFVVQGADSDEVHRLPALLSARFAMARPRSLHQIHRNQPPTICQDRLLIAHQSATLFPLVAPRLTLCIQ